MKDDTKAAIMVLIWFTVFMVACAFNNAFSWLIFIFVLALSAIYLKYDIERDHKREERKKKWAEWATRMKSGD